MSGAVDLSYTDLAVSASLILISGLISWVMRLRMEGQLALASLRTVVQLLLVGYVLRWVFDLSTLQAIAPVVLLMLVTATHTAVTRPSRHYRGAAVRAFVTMAASSLMITVTATRLIVGVTPWFEPRYLIPLLGMVLGNTMNGISLSIDHLLESLSERKAEVEMELALGATRWEAARAPLSAAIRRGMLPITNSMMVVGIVSLPGMMTGQILAGANPLVAVEYQVMIMFMIAAGTALGCVSACILAYRRLFNSKHQLRSGLIIRRGGPG